MAILLTPPRLNLPAPFKVTISIVLLLAMVSTSTAGPDFASAKKLINELKPNLNYSVICREEKSGQTKTACRIAEVPSVGFMVCNNQLLCENEISNEINIIKNISAGRVSTVKIDEEVIIGVKCAKSSDLTCAGFLEEWIDTKVGWWHRLDNSFKYNTVKKLIETVRKNIITPAGLKKTADDLKKIREFMNGTLPGKYNLICDLQGFFLYGGGFLVNDPRALKKNVGLGERCDIDPVSEPTTQQVIKGLELLINDLSRG